jgi:uncharacterized protein YoaH (UPF0181 family)
MKTPRSSKLEYDKRVRNIQEWMMQGFSSADIVRQCTTQWRITERQGYKYIKQAYQIFLAQEEKDLDAHKQFHIQTRLKLFRELHDKNQAKAAGVALSILQDIARLQALYVEKIDHTSGGKPLPIDSKHEVIFVNFSDASV